MSTFKKVINLVSIDYGTKTLGLAHISNNSIPLPLGNIDNDENLWFSLMGILAQRQAKTVLIGYPNNQGMRDKIDNFIKNLQIMDNELNIIRIDENYTSVQAQAITWESKKHVAHDTLAAMELINRYLNQIS